VFSTVQELTMTTSSSMSVNPLSSHGRPSDVFSIVLCSIPRPTARDSDSPHSTTAFRKFHDYSEEIAALRSQ
jgi:hypothetical protein